MLTADFCVPEVLAGLPRWVLWRFEERPNSPKPAKVPIKLDGRKADATDPGNWVQLDVLLDILMLLDTPHDGAGFVFSAEDGFVGIDFDGAFEKPFDASSIRPWAAEILNRFRGAYVAWSSSGTGAHIIVRGRWDAGHKTLIDDGGAVEVYTDKRFFALTGRLIDEYGALDLIDGEEALEWLKNAYFMEKQKAVASTVEIGPPPGMPDEFQAVRKALERRAKDDELLPLLRDALRLLGDTGERALQLMNGDTKAHAGFGHDQSAIEQSLANAFAIVTGGDVEFIAELLQRFSPRWENLEKLEREDYLARTAGKAAEWYRKTHRVRITIQTGAVLEPETRRLAADTLRWRYVGKLFRYGGVPVFVEADGRMSALDAARLSALLADAAMFYKSGSGKRADSRIDPPERLVRVLAAELATRGEFPELRGIVRSPLVFPDGRVVNASGYDEESALLFFDLPDVNLPSSPTRADAERAYESILKILRYRFASLADEAAAVAYLMTAVLRPVLPLAPLFLITAPEAGSGKTTLAQVGGAVAHGRIPDVLPEPEDEDEFRKRIDAALLEGRGLVILDNLHRDFRSSTLEAAITAETVSIRPLGRSETRTVPNAATFVVTGNNIAPLGDLRRRTIVIRLEKRPGDLLEARTGGEEKPFLHAVLERREELLAAVLTIASAYIRAKRPKVRGLTFPSFEAWARLIRDPLIWIGAADAVETVRRTYEEDESAAAVAKMFELLHEEFGSTPFSVRDIARVAFDDRSSLFRDVAAQLGLVDRFGGLDQRSLGYRLRAWRDRAFGGLRLERVGTAHEKVTAWRIVETENAIDEILK